VALQVLYRRCVVYSAALKHLCGSFSGANGNPAWVGQLVEEDMKTSVKLILAAGIGFGTLGLAASSASAMPMSGLDPALAKPADAAKSVEAVRWRCGPYGCHWRHGWRRRYWWGPGYGFWGPGPWWRWGFGYYPWWPTVGFWPYYYGYYW
jgi:hypothetical protein